MTNVVLDWIYNEHGHHLTDFNQPFLSRASLRTDALRFYQMFNVQTVNCMQYSQLVVIQESNSVAIMQWNEYKLRALTSKTQWFTLIEEKLFGP